MLLKKFHPKIYQKNPPNHLDIGSRTDGFVAHVACFRELDVLDIREQNSKVKKVLPSIKEIYFFVKYITVKKYLVIRA